MVGVNVGAGVGGAVTKASPVAVLLLSSGSISFPVTMALMVIVPMTEAPTSNCMVTVALVPMGRSPRLHSTIPPDSTQLPCVGSADTIVTPAGPALVSTTPDAYEGPLLVTVNWSVKLAPGMIELGNSRPVTERSALSPALVTKAPPPTD